MPKASKRAERRHARLAADAVRPPSRPHRPVARRRRDRGHCARARTRCALERPDARAPTPSRWRSTCWSWRRSLARAIPSGRRCWRLAALLHDAPEYVIGDLISPFKTAIGLDYKAFELKLLAAIHRRFGLPVRCQKTLRAPSRRPIGSPPTMRRRLAGFCADEADRFFGGRERISDPPLVRFLKGLSPLPPDAVQRAFLARFRALAASL